MTGFSLVKFEFQIFLSDINYFSNPHYIFYLTLCFGFCYRSHILSRSMKATTKKSITLSDVAKCECYIKLFFVDS